MKYFRWPLLIIAALLLVLSSFTISEAIPAISVSHEIVTDTVPQDGAAKFTLTVTNNQETDAQICLKTPTWGTVFFEDNRYILNLGPHQSSEVGVSITPPMDVRIGAYGIEIIASLCKVPTVSASDIVKVYVTTESPHIEATLGLPGRFEPGELDFNIIVKNTGARSIEDISLKLEILDNTFEEEIGTLGVGETILALDEKISVDPSVTPGTYEAKIIIMQADVIVTELKKSFEILGAENIVVGEHVEKGFLTSKYVITIKNVGNVDVTREWSVAFSSWTKPFVKTSPQPTAIKKTDGTAEFYWLYVLAPQGSTVISYTVSYIPLLALIIAIVFILYVLAWYFRQEFTITKEVLTPPKGTTLKALKIQLTVKNNTNTLQKNVIVTDRIPTPLKLVREFGTLTPSVIKKEAGTVKLIWKFAELYPGEERVLSYNLKTALGIVGLVNLPAAELRCRIDKKVKKFYSNTLTLTGRVSIREKEEE